MNKQCIRFVPCHLLGYVGCAMMYFIPGQPSPTSSASSCCLVSCSSNRLILLSGELIICWSASIFLPVSPKGGLGANNANLAIPSESVAETGTSALDLCGQIGLVNSDGGINAGRLNEESLQSGIQLSEAGPLGQEMISQKFSTQKQVINSNSQRGSTTLIKETITEDINPSRVIIDQVFEDREIAPQLVSQEIIIQGRNITHIVAGPVNGLQQGSLQI